MHSEKKKGPPARLPHENMLVIHPRVLRQRPLFDTTYDASTLSVVQIHFTTLNDGVKMRVGIAQEAITLSELMNDPCDDPNNKSGCTQTKQDKY